MKKLTRRAFTAAGLLTALGTGGVFLTSCNLIGCVYGPPPEQNEAVAMYGPPEDYDEDDETDRKDDGDETQNGSYEEYGTPLEYDPTYDPMANIEPALYGPPPSADSSEYNPEDNEIMDVYGPPAAN